MSVGFRRPSAMVLYFEPDHEQNRDRARAEKTHPIGTRRVLPDPARAFYSGVT